jgi:tetratricopeptide (TPR) repeat protein
MESDKIMESLKKFWERLRSFDIVTWFRKIRTVSFVEVGRNIRHWVIRNRNNVFIGAGIVVVLLIGAVIYTQQQGKKNEEANYIFTIGINSYNQAIMKRDSKPDEQQKMLTQAMQAFNQVQAQYAASPVSKEALYYIGNCLYASGNYQEAANRFEDFVKKYPRSYLAPFALESAGNCYEQAGDLAKAMDYYGRVKDKYPRSSVAGRSGINIGRCKEMNNDFKGAYESYQSTLAFAPNTQWAQQARLRLSFLESKFQMLSGQQKQ